MFEKLGASLFVKRVAFILLFALFIILFIDFNARVTELYSKNGQLRKIQAEVGDLYKTQHVLQTQIAYANSDAAVHEWARKEQKMIQEGDIAIAPIPGTSAVVTQTAEAGISQGIIAHWQVWWILFFSENQ